MFNSFAGERTMRNVDRRLAALEQADSPADGAHFVFVSLDQDEDPEAVLRHPAFPASELDTVVLTKTSRKPFSVRYRASLSGEAIPEGDNWLHVSMFGAGSYRTEWLDIPKTPAPSVPA